MVSVQIRFSIASVTNNHKIAFPSISTGIYHFPLEEAARIAVGTARSFAEEYPDKLAIIKCVLFDDDTYSVYSSVIGMDANGK